jgi:hypothetical protein
LINEKSFFTTCSFCHRIFFHLTNPSKSDFVSFASIELKSRNPELQVNLDQATSLSERLLIGLGNSVLSDFIKQNTDRRDYVFFSVFELDLSLARDFGFSEKNLKVIGIAGSFLSVPNSR